MPWSVPAEPQPEWLDQVLLTVGRATYVAQNFENDCKELLRALHLQDGLLGLASVEVDNVASTLDDVVAEFRRRNFTYLNRVVQQLTQRSPQVFVEDAHSILERGKNARNWIAHEGAHIDVANLGATVHGLRKLHEHVSALAAAEDLIAAAVRDHVYTSGDPEAGTRPVEVGSYRIFAERWVFAPVAGLLTASRLP